MVSCPAIEGWRALQLAARKITHRDIKKLYMKNGLLAIHKPYGLPVHGGPKVKESISTLFPGLEKRYHLPSGSLELAHRLDKNTSGVLLLTYTHEMAQRLAEMHHSRVIEKTYLAVLLGNIRKRSGVLRGDITETRQWNGKYKQTVVPDVPSPKSASTAFTVLDNSKNTCMLCSFKTTSGYKHQIRVHSSELLGCPILGDHRYHDGVGPQLLPLRIIQMLRMRGVDNNDTQSRKIRPWQRGLVPMHLLTQSIYLPELDDGEDVTISARIPEYFQQTMDLCDVVVNRDEVDAMLLNKKLKILKKIRNRESILVSKGPTNLTQETSL